MRRKKMKVWVLGIAVVVGMLFCAQGAGAASSEMDILLKILQKKGVLTEEEAGAIATEAKQAAAEAKKAEEQKAVATKAEAKEAPAKGADLPDWIKNTKFKGDLRLRYETRDREDDGRGEMSRGRFRLRAGLETAVADNITAGFGLISGTGDLRTGNQTFTGTFNKKDVWIDNAFVRYAPVKWFSLTGGKFVNPFYQPGEMLIANDINMEGAAARLETMIAPSVNLSFNTGGFIMDDRSTSTTTNTRQDPMLYVFQPGIKWDITKETAVRFAPAYYVFSGIDGKTVLTPSNTTLSRTNTAVGATSSVPGIYAYNYSAINWAGDIGFRKPFGLDFIPYFSIMAGYIENPDPSRDNIGYLAGFTVGYQDVKKFGDWSLEYTYRRLEKDAWFDLFPESSFYNGNTNVAGHRVRVLFGLTKNTAVGLNMYNTWKIRNYSPTYSTGVPNSTRDQQGEEYLFQADLTVKF
jgi:hypothetical protein